ncbi:MAG: SsrA-binding protein SmpB [Candidatus Eremiobacteraeota bacterium]|nr:SsrA-binding protein SmpB [Candidatus Eremiobacteraeota bacterium]
MTKPADFPRKGTRTITDNRRAYYEYHILDTYECGLVLVGTEVKSLRHGRVQMVDSHAQVVRQELWLYNLYINPHDKTHYDNHEAKRPRKLLLHRGEINRLIGKQEEKGLTLIPTKLYFKDGRVKLELAVAKGKKLYDKRADSATKDAKREAERAMASSRRELY